MDRDNKQNVQLITFGKRNQGGSTGRAENNNKRSNLTSSLNDRNGTGEAGTPEAERFLPPVKVDPGWDSMTSSSGDKTLTIVQQKIQEMEKCPPKDRFYLVYIIMMIHGIGVLIPWNMFINAKSYFENYKLDQGNDSSPALRDYKTNFMSYIGMASQYPNFIMNLINLFVICKGNTLGVRILTSIIIMVAMFILTVVLAVIDTSTWSEEFFWLTMASAVVVNAAVGIYQNSIFGISAVLPMKYTNAIIFGNNISGTLVAVTNIIVLLLSPSKKTSAIYYFVVAIVILMLAFDAYFVTHHCKFYNHHVQLAALKKQEFHDKSETVEPSYVLLFKSLGRVFTKVFHLYFGIWWTFFITLALFPAVMSDVKPVSMSISGEYWTAIFCFLCFNLFATLGNLTTEFIRWPNARWVNLLVFLRVGFVPLMLLSNFRPELRTIPVFLPYDGVFIATAILFSWSHGYCSSLVMMYAPKCVAPNDSPVAGMSMALFLVFGILCGVNFSRVWGLIVGSG